MEPMEIDSAMTSFTAERLFGLSDSIGSDDIPSIVNADIASEFGRCVTFLCEELKTLYKLDESVPQCEAAADGMMEFLLELSSFLAELECPHEEITCGSLEERLSTPEKKTLLISFLLSELKAARLFASDALSQPLEHGDKELTPYLASALRSAKVPKPSGGFVPADVVDMLRKTVEGRLQSCVERPRPLLTAKLDSKQWRKVDKTQREYRQPYQDSPRDRGRGGGGGGGGRGGGRGGYNRGGYYGHDNRY
ncbi:unnamed protein product [Heligmosomoides polygyrus]|uniref:Uncharacterized protein n=1 Tax=Heligmosomoides polygyrus TaxID=6339 RepID=A0A3P7WVK3_HELPZ|nr:unnamed protein product [Heligmosomoides polygyrus]